MEYNEVYLKKSANKLAAGVRLLLAVVLTSTTPLSFIYVLPLMSMMVLYKDKFFMLRTAQGKLHNTLL